MSFGSIPANASAIISSATHAQFLDERLCLCGDVKPPRAAVGRIGDPLDELASSSRSTIRDKRDRLDVEHVGELDLPQPGLPLEPEQHLPLRARDAHAAPRGGRTPCAARAPSRRSRKEAFPSANRYSKPAYIKQRLRRASVPLAPQISCCARVPDWSLGVGHHRRLNNAVRLDGVPEVRRTIDPAVQQQISEFLQQPYIPHRLRGRAARTDGASAPAIW